MNIHVDLDFFELNGNTLVQFDKPIAKMQLYATSIVQDHINAVISNTYIQFQWYPLTKQRGFYTTGENPEEQILKNVADFRAISRNGVVLVSLPEEESSYPGSLPCVVDIILGNVKGSKVIGNRDIITASLIQISPPDITLTKRKLTL